MTESHDDNALDMVPRTEAQRRIRSVVAMARSLVRRTAQGSESVEEFEHHLDGRLLALARSEAHALAGIDPSVDLELIVHDELRAVLEKASGRVTISGEEIRLPIRLAETFTFVVQELLTNALKFGALCCPAGTILVTWRRAIADDMTYLHFQWIEHTPGLSLAFPIRRGFGSDLLEEVMRYEHDADPNLQFRTDGLAYAVRVPLPT